jgi:asparagine synthase (glutamine-hydrolysing)
MCGIAGLVGSHASLERVARMTALLHHRGPDDRGVSELPGAVLGHTRLAILDLSAAGHQPMEFGDFVITYNGEIYNFRELRRELGGEFRSDSDTEVLLRLYARDGARCLGRLHGMFAFAIWDRRERRLFAARDRLGIKPFFYAHDRGDFAFASEVKALRAVQDFAPEPAALRDYLTYGYVPAPRTAYAGIAQLPPASSLTWHDGRLTVERWWSPAAGIRRRDAAATRDELDALLSVVVREHTLADVPVGVFLSGGLDSATLAWYLDRPRTFTLGFDSAERSEADAARAVATHLGTRHAELVAARTGVEDALRLVPKLFDAPFSDSAAWSNYLISGLARREVVVALSGEGGDEIFCGYPRYWKSSDGNPRWWAQALAPFVPPLSPLGQSLQRRTVAGVDLFASRVGLLNPAQCQALVHPRLLEDGYDPHWFYRQHWREDLEPAQRMRWLDLHTSLPEALLTKVDRTSMAHSLEVRPPLLDHRLVEFALSVDPRLLIDRSKRRGKRLVRELMAPRLPAGHLTRRKQGFGLPVRRWLRTHPELLARVSRRLMDRQVLRRPIPLGFPKVWGLLALDSWLEQA